MYLGRQKTSARTQSSYLHGTLQIITRRIHINEGIIYTIRLMFERERSLIQHFNEERFILLKKSDIFLFIPYNKRLNAVFGTKFSVFDQKGSVYVRKLTGWYKKVCQRVQN